MKEKDADAYRTLVAERGMDRGPHLDDRQQPEVGHEPGAGSRAECGLRAARAYLAVGEVRDRAGGGQLLKVSSFEDLRELF